MTPVANVDALHDLYQDWSARLVANPNYTIADLRSIFDEWHQPTREPEGVCYREETLGGVPAIWALPIDADTTKVIVYTHGGGFAVGSASSHRKLAGHLAKALGATAVVLDYRRSPEHPFPAQIEDAVAAYQALLAQGIQPHNITTAGDSAGGNLAISSVLKLRDLSLPLPGAVIAFSPWLDMEHVGQTLVSNDATDALVHKPLLEAMSGMFLGESGSRTDPLANPLKANYRGFPRLYMNAGSVETLLDNAVDLTEIARSAGAQVELSVVKNMQHVFPMLAGRAPEADEELQRIARWFRQPV